MIAFVIGILLTYLTKNLAKRIRPIMTLNLTYSYLTVVSGVYASYTLGANTLGLIIGLDPTGTHSTTVSVLFGLATILGMFVFSKGTTRSVAENIIGMNQSEAFASQLATCRSFYRPRLHRVTDASLSLSGSDWRHLRDHGSAQDRSTQ